MFVPLYLCAYINVYNNLCVCLQTGPSSEDHVTKVDEICQEVQEEPKDQVVSLQLLETCPEMDMHVTQHSSYLSNQALWHCWLLFNGTGNLLLILSCCSSDAVGTKAFRALTQTHC